MRVVYIVLGLALVGAVVATFYLKGPAVASLMDPDESDGPDTPVEVYRWRDAEGIWQFGDNPPDPASAERVEIRPNITPIKADWVAQVKERKAAEEAPRKKLTPAEKSTSGIGDVYDGQALQKAKDAAGQLESQTEQLEALMKTIGQKP